jgi:hypothetical protein
MRTTRIGKAFSWKEGFDLHLSLELSWRRKRYYEGREIWELESIYIYIARYEG